MGLHRRKLAVLDLTHGGIPIAKSLAAAGNEVTGIDVYGTVEPGTLLELEEKHGICCSKIPFPSAKFDLLVAPVHLDSAYPMLVEARSQGKIVLSHHQIVGEILKGDSRLSGIKTVEVTGVKAKTSTASLLADMLSRRFEVVLHTSRGLEYWKAGSSSLIHRGLSITPGSILVAVEKVFESGLMPDFFIFEISIGGTGTADFGILTTLSPDYGIANNTALASEAKLQLVRHAKPESVLLINSRAENALKAAKKSQAKVLTFKDPFIVEPPQIPDQTADFVLESECRPAPSSISKFSTSSELSGSFIRFMHRGKEIFSVSPRPGYNFLAYRTAFVAASAAALELGIGHEAITSVIEKFGGLSGRMQEKVMNGICLIDNSNSGMDILSAEKALEYALLKKKDERKGSIILVLGEEASQVCEGLPPESVQRFVKKFGIKCSQVILVGERMRIISGKNVSYAGNLHEGLLKASKFAGGEDIILSSVKCFR
ncbi:MAG: coenzyme F430 synthase [Methanosarcina flavescens]|jgi:UDP-N-acetylmuramyl pentapeptide synthase|uniref:Coenzyme F430 synthase n=1 Tax=Methanosarcina flavescens TaxID=1715806 RepID=A0A660HPZ9_9EURY|nr:coenzyme F430 synthase [Methanosarcina flavescens]AYK14324.1 coenzyme F430 synthase [Methanosarcina flavescens]NLK32309.1 coenzyme F430 synthase [Methanosarcina flavescens]